MGNIATNFHAVSLRLKSVLDGCGQEADDEPYREQQGSALVSNADTSMLDDASLPGGPLGNVKPPQFRRYSAFPASLANLGREEGHREQGPVALQAQGRSVAGLFEPTIPEEQSSARQVAEGGGSPGQAGAPSNASVQQPGTASSAPPFSPSTARSQVHHDPGIHGLTGVPAKGAKPARSQDTDMTCDPTVEQVKKYCINRSEVDFDTTALHLTDVGTADLTR